jgi:hypothetical protein
VNAKFAQHSDSMLNVHVQKSSIHAKKCVIHPK